MSSYDVAKKAGADVVKQWDATLDDRTREDHRTLDGTLAEVDEEKCTACGACAKACPRGIIEIRLKGPKGRRVVVLCNNKDKGAIANKACKASCIGCGKCVKTCEKFEAITLENNLAYIDAEKCKMCRKCEEACPKGAIHGFNFPPKKEKPAAEQQVIPNNQTTKQPND